MAIIKDIKKKKALKKRPPMNASTAAQALMLKEKQRYVQGYLQVVRNLYKKNTFTPDQARLAEVAYKRKLPPSGYVSLVRQQDPHYVKTQDFAKRQADAKAAWTRFRPNRPMPQEFSAKYIHSSLNQQQLIEQVNRSLKAQQAVALPKRNVIPSSHAAYGQLRTMLNDAFQKHTGNLAHPDLHRMIFSARVNDQHIHDKFPDLFGGKEAFNWLAGDAAKRQQSTVDAIAPRLSTVPSPFITQAQNAFDIGVADLGSGLISSEIIK